MSDTGLMTAHMIDIYPASGRHFRATGNIMN